MVWCDVAYRLGSAAGLNAVEPLGLQLLAGQQHGALAQTLDMIATDLKKRMRALNLF